MDKPFKKKIHKDLYTILYINRRLGLILNYDLLLYYGKLSAKVRLQKKIKAQQ